MAATPLLLRRTTWILGFRRLPLPFCDDEIEFDDVASVASRVVFLFFKVLILPLLIGFSISGIEGEEVQLVSESTLKRVFSVEGEAASMKLNMKRRRRKRAKISNAPTLSERERES